MEKASNFFAVPMDRAKPAEREQLLATARADAHAVICPSHIFLKDEQVIGYAGQAPTVFFWSRRSNSPRLTFALADFVEQNSTPPFVVPCGADSPLLKFMPKRGYRHLGAAEWFLMERQSNGTY